MVIVDLDKSVGKQAEIDILNISDIVVALVPQRAKKIEKIQNMINEGEILKEQNTVGNRKICGRIKISGKNITRNLLRKKDLINTIPYNTLFFDFNTKKEQLLIYSWILWE